MDLKRLFAVTLASVTMGLSATACTIDTELSEEEKALYPAYEIVPNSFEDLVVRNLMETSDSHGYFLTRDNQNYSYHFIAIENEGGKRSYFAYDVSRDILDDDVESIFEGMNNERRYSILPLPASSVMKYNSFDDETGVPVITWQNNFKLFNSEFIEGEFLLRGREGLEERGLVNDSFVLYYQPLILVENHEEAMEYAHLEEMKENSRGYGINREAATNLPRYGNATP